MSNALPWMHTLRALLRKHVDQNPSLFRLTYRLARRPTEVLVCRESDLLIEGFPRSANSYAAWAFKLANPDLRLAHHVHSPAHILLALRYNVPVLVLLREPEPAIRSLLVRQPELGAAEAIRRYHQFYSVVAPYSEQLIIGKFDTVTQNFPRLIEAVNNKFKRRFMALALEDEAGQAKILAAIDQANKKGHGGQINPRFVPRPHPERERLKADLAFTAEGPKMQAAQAIYDHLLSHAI